MNISYKVENYYPGEYRLFCIYTPQDASLDSMGGWVHITAEMTEAQMQASILAQAPYHQWEATPSPVALALLGSTGSGDKPVPPAVVPDTLDELTITIQQRLDDFARTRKYDSILSLSSYATDPNPKFAAEGQYGVDVRSATWATIHEIMESVKACDRPMPTLAEIEAELPVLAWPV